MPVVFASAGIWSPLEIRSAASAAAATDARPPPAALSAIRSPTTAAASIQGGLEWSGRGSQLQASVATQRAMQRREEERARGSNPAAATAAALAARVAAQAAVAASAAPLSWMSPPVPAALPSSLPLGEYGSLISPVKLSRRDQLILSTFEWGHRPQPSYMPPPLSSPQSAPSKAQNGEAERSQQRSGSRPASRAAEADRSQLHRSRSTGTAAARQPRSTPASTSFAAAVSPLSYRTGDVSSLVGVTPLDKAHSASRNQRADPLLLSDYSDPMLSSPHAPLPLRWATGPRDAYLDSLAHTKMRMQKEAAAAAHARPARNDQMTPYAQRPVDSSSRSGLSSDISAAAAGDLSPLPHSSLHPDRSSSSDASRWQHSSDHSSLLLLTHLSDSPADYNS